MENDYQFDLKEAWHNYFAEIRFKADYSHLSMLGNCLNEIEILRKLLDECRKKEINRDAVNDILSEYEYAFLDYISNKYLFSEGGDK
jgi:hypothetical protein